MPSSEVQVARRALFALLRTFAARYGLPRAKLDRDAAEQELREAVVLRRVGIQDRGEAAGQEQVEEGQGREVVGAVDDLRARAGGVGAA